MSKKTIIQLIILLAVILAVAAYFVFFNKSNETVKDQSVLAKILEFKVVRTDLSQAQIEEYKKDFDEDIKTVLNSQDRFDLAVLNNIGMIKRTLRDFDGAKETWNFLSLNRPKNSISFFNLGLLYAEDLKDNKKAEENYLMALKNSAGESGNEQYYRAIVDFYTYNYPEKKTEIEKILLDVLKTEQYAESVDILSLLATYYQNNGEKENALIYWQKILKLDPNNMAVKGEIERLKNK
jgi:tetratricopeptide (TPR) repeat protein